MMAGQFRFNLQKILEMREDALKSCERAFDHAIQVREQLRSMLVLERDSYIDEREALNVSVREARFETLAIYEGSLDSRKRKIIDLLEAVRAAESEVDLANQNLIQARRDFKVLENLREKKSLEHRTKIEQAEQKTLDEQSTLRYARREAALNGVDVKKGNS